MDLLSSRLMILESRVYFLMTPYRKVVFSVIMEVLFATEVRLEAFLKNEKLIFVSLPRYRNWFMMDFSFLNASVNRQKNLLKTS